MKNLLPISTLCFLASAALYTLDTITERNWKNHPEIVEVRSLCQAINELKNAGKLKKMVRKFNFCMRYEDTIRTLYTDGEGKPRIYYYNGGSDDSALQRELYYDEKGMLRFAIIIASAVNGTILDHRVYFSQQGIKISEIQKLLTGPGYTFPKVWPEHELIKNPIQAFNKEHPCPEIK